ncbi:hypothetical protein [Paenibacillus radicibacter]|uniref:hypothetical protein n=1 Tax=Paenibacillus radicibacter TaxID=2972488 RepID=UPI002158C95B|nr:hypothetical protein [Paenibacillus radicibacter]
MKLKTEIIIYDNKIHILIDLLRFRLKWTFKELKEILFNSHINGAFTDKNDKIIILMYNIKLKCREEDSYLILFHTISTLYHEIRHSYQRVNNPFKWCKGRMAYVSEGDGYIQQWTEKDAYGFGNMMFDRYLNKICDILFEKENVK